MHGSIQALVLLYTEPDVAAPFSPGALPSSHALLPGAALSREADAHLAELIAQVSVKPSRNPHETLTKPSRNPHETLTGVFGPSLRRTTDVPSQLPAWLAN
jgi:hypothetical protein